MTVKESAKGVQVDLRFRSAHGPVDHLSAVSGTVIEHELCGTRLAIYHFSEKNCHLILSLHVCLSRPLAHVIEFILRTTTAPPHMP